MITVDSVGSCATGLRIRLLNTPANGPLMAFAPDGTLYFAGYGCSPTVGGTGVQMIFRRSPAGVIEVVAGMNATGSLTEGALGPATIVDVQSLAFDSVLGILYGDGAHYRVRAIDPATLVVRTLVGDGTSGTSGDYGPASAARVHSPRGLATTADHHLIIADLSAYLVREVW